MIIVGAPAYLEQRGVPVTVKELEAHNRIGFSFPRRVAAWPLTVHGEQIELMPQGNLCVSDGETMRKLPVK